MSAKKTRKAGDDAPLISPSFGKDGLVKSSAPFDEEDELDRLSPPFDDEDELDRLSPPFDDEDHEEVEMKPKKSDTRIFAPFDDEW